MKNRSIRSTVQHFLRMSIKMNVQENNIKIRFHLIYPGFKLNKVTKNRSKRKNNATITEEKVQIVDEVSIILISYKKERDIE